MVEDNEKQREIPAAPKRDVQINEMRRMDNGSKIAIAIVAVFLFFGLVILGGLIFFKKGISHFNFRNGMMAENGSFDSGSKMMGRGGFHRENIGNQRINGEIMAINDAKLTVKYNDKEITVNVLDNTSIQKDGNIAKFSDLETADKVVILGTSNSNGELNASFIVVN